MEIYPSVMAKNQKEIDDLLKKYSGLAKKLHLDIVDGKFAKNMSLNFEFRLSNKFKYNAHLMVKNPIDWIKKNEQKVDLYIVQWSEVAKPSEFIQWMHKLKKKVAFALKPEESVVRIKPYLKNVDYILVLTVNPGFYGSKYLNEPLLKIGKIKKINPKIKIMVDGGMNPRTVKDAKKAGADIIVCGSYLAKSDDVKKAMGEIVRSLS